MDKNAAFGQGPGAVQTGLAVSLSSPLDLAGTSGGSSITAPTLAGPLPPGLSTKLAPALTKSGPVSSTSSFSASRNGPAPVVSRPIISTTHSHSVPPSSRNLLTSNAPTLATVADSPSPLTFRDVKTGPNPPVNYSLPSVGGATKTVPLSEHTQLNGSILDHLSPASSAPHSAPELAVKSKERGGPSLAVSDGVASYDITKQSWPTRSTKTVAPPTKSMAPPIKAVAPPTSVSRPGEGQPLRTSAPPTKYGEGPPAGATQGGVLLKHIPYLPAKSESLGVGAGREGPVADGGVASQEVLESGGRGSVEKEEIAELEQKMKAQAQTIDILVSEKSGLQMETRSLRAQLATKNRESQDYELHAKGTRQKLSDLEREISTMTSELSGKREEFKRAKLETIELRASLERLRGSLEDQQEESTELISKVTAQSAEILELRNTKTELQSKLNMAELLTQQLSQGKPLQTTPTDHTLSSKLQEVKGQAKELQRKLEVVSREKEQVNSDLLALEDSMRQQQRDSTKKLKECETQLAEARANVSAMKKEMEEMQAQKEVLSSELATEHAQCEQSSQAARALESAEQEKEQLRVELEKQVQENIQLVKTNTELESHALEVELKLSRLQERSVDHQSLLTSMAQDKETLSRAMSQNKELKHNMVELQDAIIKWSNQNMELASELETEKRRVTYLKTQLTSARETTPPTATPLPPVVATPTTAPPHVMPVEGGSEEGEGAESGEEGGVVEGSVLIVEKQQEIDALVVENEHLKEEFEQLQVQYSSLQQLQRELLARGTPPPVSPPLSAHASPPRQGSGGEGEGEEGVSHSPGEVLSSGRGVGGVAGSRTGMERGPAELSEVVPSAELPLDSGQRRGEEEVEQTDNGPTPIPDHTYPPGGHAHPPASHTHPISSQELAQLQSSFNALQKRFVSLMREKADLLDKIQEHEVVILRLSSETETIGDYISLYQTQREALKGKFQEKDNFIQQLVTEKATMQANIKQLQVLMRKVIWEQARNRPTWAPQRTQPPPTTPHPPSVLSQAPLTPHLTSTPSASHTATPLPRSPQHPGGHAESANIPFHLRTQFHSAEPMQEVGGVDVVDSASLLDVENASHMTEDTSHMTEDTSNMTGDSSHVTDGDSPVTTATAEQIMELLDQLESNSHLTGVEENGGEVMVQCRHCTGPLLTV